METSYLSPQSRVLNLYLSVISLHQPKKDARVKEHANRLIARTAIPRLGEPNDVSLVVAFLCSSDASYISRQVICIHGGHSVIGFWPCGYAGYPHQLWKGLVVIF